MPLRRQGTHPVPLRRPWPLASSVPGASEHEPLRHDPERFQGIRVHEGKSRDLYHVIEKNAVIVLAHLMF